MLLSRLIINDKIDVGFTEKSFISWGPNMSIKPSQILSAFWNIKAVMKGNLAIGPNKYILTLKNNKGGFEYPLKITIDKDGKVKTSGREEDFEWIKNNLHFPGEDVMDIPTFITRGGPGLVGFYEIKNLSRDTEGHLVGIYDGDVEIPLTENEEDIINVIMSHGCDCFIAPNYIGRFHILLWEKLILETLPEIHRQVITFGWDDKEDSAKTRNWDIVYTED